MTTMLDAALGYARSGWKIFPLHSIDAEGHCTCGAPDVGGIHGAEGRSRGKHPRTTDGSKSATTDEATVREWWTRWPDANIAFVAGPYCDVFVLDVDGDHGGMLTLDELQARHDALPATRTVTTGGGLHLYFRFPLGEEQELRPRNGTLYELDGTPLPGLDLRGGGNGYVLLPPSRHFSGRTYQWSAATGDRIETCPDWLWQVIVRGKPAPKAAPKAPAKPSTPAVHGEIQMAAYMRKALAGAADDIRAAGRGSAAHELIYDRAHRFGGYVGAGCVDEGTVVATLIEAGLATGKPELEVRKAVTDGVRVGMSKPVRPELQERVTREDFLRWRAENPNASTTEAASVLGVPVGTAKTWTRRASESTPNPGAVDSLDRESGSESDRESANPDSGSDWWTVAEATNPARVDSPDSGLGANPANPDSPDSGRRANPEGVDSRSDSGSANPDSRPVLEQLAELARLLEVEDSDSRIDELMRQIMAPAFLRALAEARLLDSVAGAIELQKIRRVRSAAPLVSSAEKAIAGLVRDMKRARTEPASVAAITAQDVRRALGRLADTLQDVPAGLQVPAAFELSASGVSAVSLDKDGDEKHTEICLSPLFVAGESVDVDGAGSSLDIRWHDRRGWCQRWVPRGVALVARSLAELAQHGLPVSSASAPNVVRYLEAFCAQNSARWVKRKTSMSLGWRGDAFLWGSQAITREGEACDVVLDASDPGVTQLVAGYRTRGTWSGWCAAIEKLTPYPRLILALAAACVPPLYHVIPEAPNFILEWAGKTSGGKTTALRVAASAWGDPADQGAGLVKTWDASATSIERTAAFASYLPLLLDDTKRVREKDAALLQRMVYSVVQGSGRMRATVTGLQRQVNWRTVLLTTGEERITDVATAGGAAARVLSIWGSPFNGASAEHAILARSTAMDLADHHGHVGPRMVRWLQAQDPERVREMYRASCRSWGQRAGGNAVAERAVGYIALLDVALCILQELGVPLVAQPNPLFEAWQAIQHASAVADVEVQALHAVYEWAASAETSFYGRHLWDGAEPKAPHGGWLGAWRREGWDRLCIVPAKLDEYLARHDYPAKTIRQAWKDKGWLICEAERQTTNVRLGTGQFSPLVRVVAVSRAALEQIGAIDRAPVQQPLPAANASQEEW